MRQMYTSPRAHQAEAARWARLPLRVSGLSEVHHRPRQDRKAPVFNESASRKTLWDLRHIWYCFSAEHQQADVRW